MSYLSCHNCGVVIPLLGAPAERCPECGHAQASHGERLGGASRASDLAIQAIRRDDRYSVRLEGELDLASASGVEELVEGLCVDRAREIVLDVGGLSFIDSAGVRAILRGQALCAEHVCRFRLIGTDTVERLLELSDLLSAAPAPTHSPAASPVA